MKALRREFAELHGRAPLGTRLEAEPYRVTNVKAAKPTRQAGWNPSGRIRSRIVERFLRAICKVTVLQPSEWRQWKKRHTAENPDTVETRRNVERLRHQRETQQNNLRIEDRLRYGTNRNFARGKQKRSGVYATARGL